MNWLSFLSYVVASVFTPGPNNISSMSNAGRYGFSASSKYRLGIFVGFFIIQALGALCSAFLLDLIPSVQPYLLACGAAYILWMAWKTFTSTTSDEHGQPHDNTFAAGALLQLINVKVILFALTTMSVYAVPHSTSPVFLLFFGLVMSVLSLISITCWAAFGAIFNRVLRRHEKCVNTVLALLLVWCAISLYL